ncbi:MAG: hypothetical protein N5P05_004097 (plasmid) [Chroococcopsis gigantea SAG 12.99]|jgi:hypothetical protein|nr:hypothetical protein [Chroococcopsis gigantea SAG 12.99]
MPARKTSAISPITDELLGEFAVSDYSERVYTKVYYAIRERQAFVIRKQIGDEFNWQNFKGKFAEAFGTPDNRRFTIEQLLDYAQRKFGMSLEDLIEANNRSWERRRQWEEERSAQYQDAPDYGYVAEEIAG